jgi:hypothetical protein
LNNNSEILETLKRFADSLLITSKDLQQNVFRLAEDLDNHIRFTENSNSSDANKDCTMKETTLQSVPNRSEEDDVEINEWQSKVVAFEQSNQQLAERNQVLESLLAEKEKMVDDLQSNVHRLKNENDNLSSQILEGVNSLQVSNNELSRLYAEKQEIEDRLSEKLHTLAVKDAAIAHLEIKINALQEKYELMSCHVECVDKKSQEIVTQLVSSNQINEEISRDLSASNLENHNLLRSLKEKEDEIHTLSDRLRTKDFENKEVAAQLGEYEKVFISPFKQVLHTLFSTDSIQDEIVKLGLLRSRGDDPTNYSILSKLAGRLYLARWVHETLVEFKKKNPTYLSEQERLLVNEVNHFYRAEGYMWDVLVIPVPGRFDRSTVQDLFKATGDYRKFMNVYAPGFYERENGVTFKARVEGQV